MILPFGVPEDVVFWIQNVYLLGYVRAVECDVGVHVALGLGLGTLELSLSTERCGLGLGLGSGSGLGLGLGLGLGRTEPVHRGGVGKGHGEA